MNEIGRKIKEQYADTGGFTDHVFELMRWMPPPDGISYAMMV